MQEGRRRVLVVDDDPDTLFLIGRALSKAGYVVEACSEACGIVESRHEVPDLFVLDRGLPAIDGIAVGKYLRLQPATMSTPIIMISGEESENRAKRVGINEFLLKPFRLKCLVELVDKYIRRRGNEG
jgi:DNA-binding response OmpR family regulator